MPTQREPLIRLEPDGKAPLLSYDIPQPSVYFGTNFIELGYGPRSFTKKARKKPDKGMRLMVEEIRESFDEEELVEEVQKNIETNFANAALFPNAQVDAASVKVRDHRKRDHRSSEEAAAEEASAEQMQQQGEAAGEEAATEERPRTKVRAKRGQEALEAREIAQKTMSGKRLNAYQTMYGDIRYNYVREPERVEPAILLVETYRMATYLGSYGAGRIVKTFSLLPGERTKISVRTFRKSEKSRQESSSILDSFSEESAADFETTIGSEQSDKGQYEKSFQYHAEAEAKAGWGWGSASVKGGVKGGSNSAREEFSKNTSSATNKHAQKASSKREVEVNTNYEERETREREKSIERELENINVSRTLNYVFRQMNQEFITILSLVDVRVAFFNGFPETKKEVSLAELDNLLEEYITSKKRKDVRRDIHDSLANILDYQGKLHEDFVEERSVGEDSYLRVRKEKTSTYKDAATGTEIEVPGVILSATKNVMRTEGIMVESLLGAGEALDGYTSRLQELEVERRRAETAREKAMADQAALATEAVRKKDEEQANLLKDLWPEKTSSHPVEVTVRQNNNSDHGREQE